MSYISVSDVHINEETNSDSNQLNKFLTFVIFLISVHICHWYDHLKNLIFFFLSACSSLLWSNSQTAYICCYLEDSDIQVNIF